ncbi:MAG: phenylalanine--tRNA ligase subunit beta [Breznakibacter sp.]
MNISYNWLKNYINLDIEPAKAAEILTSIGLEVGSVEEVQSVKGGLEGLVVGHVLTCQRHPNADKLSVTTVDVGSGEPLPIVCGAPNVAAGQKVVVATVGTVLYGGDGSFTIKKAKIRGEVSEGMICAEDEIGLGTSHDGIMVLPADIPVGLPAKDYFKIENNAVIEVDITPNRIDSASHFGVARDLAASLSQSRHGIVLTRPSVDAFKQDNNDFPIHISVENTEACPRYSGVTISGITVGESPDWLKARLKAIGLSPINNVVDVTNFVLHELGQPLHAFDGDKITGHRVVVKNLADKTPFMTLDGKTRELHHQDLMICNAHEGMCIAGVFGGLDSGVGETTTKVFLESACFNPVYIRKTAKRHILSTDASFRFERGTDPNITLYALKRAALLIKEVAGGTISSEVVDIYPNPVADAEIGVSYAQVERLIGKDLGAETIKRILTSLEIKIKAETNERLIVQVPPYRVDVTREVDVIEEILRIYGYNQVEMPDTVHSTLVYSQKPNHHKLRNLVAEQLVGAGFQEIMCNSLTKAAYYDNLTSFPATHTVLLANPLSNDLNGMRQTLLFGVLESAQHNRNRRQTDLKLFEFGNCYFYDGQSPKGELKGYSETQQLALAVTGNEQSESWHTPTREISFYWIKTQVENIFARLGITDYHENASDSDLFAEAITLTDGNKKPLAILGKVSPVLLKQFDIDRPVYYAQLNWDVLANKSAKTSTLFAELPKFPEVRRDLALLVDKQVTFAQIHDLAVRTGRKLLKKVSLFDVYEGEKLGADKKSYAVSFTLQDESKTLADVEIDRIMQNLINTFTKELGAQLR